MKSLHNKEHSPKNSLSSLSNLIRDKQTFEKRDTENSRRSYSKENIGFLNK